MGRFRSLFYQYYMPTAWRKHFDVSPLRGGIVLLYFVLPILNAYGMYNTSIVP